MSVRTILRLRFRHQHTPCLFQLHKVGIPHLRCHRFRHRYLLLRYPLILRRLRQFRLTYKAWSLFHKPLFRSENKSHALRGYIRKVHLRFPSSASSRHWHSQSDHLDRLSGKLCPIRTRLKERFLLLGNCLRTALPLMYTIHFHRNNKFFRSFQGL